MCIDYVTLLEVTDNFWSLPRTAECFEILGKKCIVRSPESPNLAQNTRVHIFKCQKSAVPEVKIPEVPT